METNGRNYILEKNSPGLTISGRDAVVVGCSCRLRVAVGMAIARGHAGDGARVGTGGTV